MVAPHLQTLSTAYAIMLCSCTLTKKEWAKTVPERCAKPFRSCSLPSTHKVKFDYEAENCDLCKKEPFSKTVLVPLFPVSVVPSISTGIVNCQSSQLTWPLQNCEETWCTMTAMLLLPSSQQGPGSYANALVFTYIMSVMWESWSGYPGKLSWGVNSTGKCIGEYPWGHLVEMVLPSC